MLHEMTMCELAELRWQLHKAKWKANKKGWKEMRPVHYIIQNESQLPWLCEVTCKDKIIWDKMKRNDNAWIRIKMTLQYDIKKKAMKIHELKWR